VQTFSFEVNKKLWDEEVFPQVKEIFLKCGKEVFLIVKQILLDQIKLLRKYYDPLIILKGLAGSLIDKMNIDSSAVNMFLDYLEEQIVNLSWEEIVK